MSLLRPNPCAPCMVRPNPAASIAQQKLFGIALAVKRGEIPRSRVTKVARNLADSLSEKKLREFAKTSHAGLKYHVEDKAANPWWVTMDASGHYATVRARPRRGVSWGPFHIEREAQSYALDLENEAAFAESTHPAFAAANPRGKINQKGYKWYVLANNGDGPLYIESGWEFREDAKEHLADLPSGWQRRIVAKVTLKGLGLDPDQNTSWLQVPAGWNPKYSAAQLRKGIKVEAAEHRDVTGGDPRIAWQIAKAHLAERPDYYDALERLERGECNPDEIEARHPHENWLPAEKAKEYSPDRYDFLWNEDYTKFVPKALLWWDDASYRRYQSGADYEDNPKGGWSALKKGRERVVRRAGSPDEAKFFSQGFKVDKAFADHEAADEYRDAALAADAGANPALGPFKRIRFLDHRGQVRTGKIVMRGPAGWVVNVGGAHGTPVVVPDEAIITGAPFQGKAKKYLREIGLENPKLLVLNPSSGITGAIERKLGRSLTASEKTLLAKACKEFKTFHGREPRAEDFQPVDAPPGTPLFVNEVGRLDRIDYTVDVDSIRKGRWTHKAGDHGRKRTTKPPYIAAIPGRKKHNYTIVEPKGSDTFFKPTHGLMG